MQLTTEKLKIMLANSYALYLKTQNYHWNVMGENFKNFHELFGAQYEELAEAIDEIAERIRALDALVPASFNIFSQFSELQEGDEGCSDQMMVSELYQDNLALSKIANSALEVAQEEGDEVTADMMIQRMKIHEKNAWMLKSSLK